MCTVCTVHSTAVWSTLRVQAVYMVQLYVCLLGKQDKHRGIFNTFVMYL